MLILCCFAPSARAQLLRVGDPQATDLTTTGADIRWSVANDTGKGAAHVVFYWEDGAGNPGIWHPGYLHEGWYDASVWHPGYYEHLWHEGWWENTVWHEGWFEPVWHGGYFEEVWRAPRLEEVYHDGWYEDVWHEGYTEEIYHDAGWYGSLWHEAWTESIWHEGYSEQVWRDAYTEEIFHEGHWDQTWHEPYYETVYVGDYYEDIYHEGYWSQVWHEGYWENTTWHDAYGEYIYHDGWYEQVHHDGYWEQTDVWHDGYEDENGVWYSGYYEQVWHEPYTTQLWHEPYSDYVWHEAYWERLWHDGYWENTIYNDGYTERVWRGPHYENVLRDGYWENTTWHDGEVEYIYHPAGFQEVWHDGYVEEVYHEGYWDDLEWHDAYTESVVHEGYSSQIWRDGYYEQVWRDAYTEQVWHPDYYEYIPHDGYWDQVWHGGYAEAVWHEAYDEPGQWHPPYWVKGWWESGIATPFTATATSDPGNGPVSVLLPNLLPGHTYNYFVKSVIAADTDNVFDPSNDTPDIAATAPASGAFFQFTTPATLLRITETPVVTETTAGNAVVTIGLANDTGNTVHHFISLTWASPNGVESRDFQVDSAFDCRQVAIAFNDLIAGTSYTYSVFSVVDGHSAGEAGYDNSLTGAFSTPALIHVGGPQYADLSTNSVTVTWSFQNDSDSSVTHVLSLQTGDTSTHLTCNSEAGPGGSNVVFSVEALTPGNYTVAVRSFLNDPAGNGGAQRPGYCASSAGELTVPERPLISISGLHYENLAARRADVVWAVSNSSGHAATHALYCAGDYPGGAFTGPYSPITDSNNSDLRVSLSDLPPGSTNTVIVQSALTGVEGYAPLMTQAVAFLTVRTPAILSITDAPARGLVDTATRSTTLSWGVENNSGETVNNTVNYTWRGPTGKGSGVATTATGPGQNRVTVTIANLVANATYTFDAASTVDGHETDPACSRVSSGSFTVTAQELSGSQVISISGVRTNWVTETTAVIGWQVSQADPGDLARHYVVATTNFPPFDLQQAVIVEGFEDTNQTGAVTAVLSGLTPGATYHYYVQSIIKYTEASSASDLNGGDFYSFTTPPDGGVASLNPTGWPSVIIPGLPAAGPVGQTNAVVTWDFLTLTNLASHYIVFSPNTIPTPTNAFIATASHSLSNEFGVAFADLQGLPSGQTNFYFVESAIDFGCGNSFVMPLPGYFNWFVTGTNEGTGISGGTVLFGTGTGFVDGSGSGGGSGGSGGTGGSTDSGGTGDDTSGGSGGGTAGGTGAGGGTGGGTDTIPQQATMSVTFSISSSAVREWMSEKADGSGEKEDGNNDYAGAKITWSGTDGVSGEKQIKTTGIGASYWFGMGAGYWWGFEAEGLLGYMGFGYDGIETTEQVTVDIPVKLGETYTFTFDWTKRPSVKGYEIRAGALLSSTNCVLVRSEDTAKGWRESTIRGNKAWYVPPGDDNLFMGRVGGFYYDGTWVDDLLEAYVYPATKVESGSLKTWQIMVPKATLTKDPDLFFAVCAYTDWFDDVGWELEPACTAEIKADYKPDTLPEDFKNEVWIDVEFKKTTNASPGRVTAITEGSVWKYTGYVEAPSDLHPVASRMLYYAEAEGINISPRKYELTVKSVFDWLTSPTGPSQNPSDSTARTHQHGPKATPHVPNADDYKNAYRYIRWKYGFLNSIKPSGCAMAARFNNDNDPQIAMQDQFWVYFPTPVKAVAAVHPITGNLTMGLGAFRPTENICASIICHELVHTTQHIELTQPIASWNRNEKQAYQWQLDTKALTGIDENGPVHEGYRQEIATFVEKYSK